MAINKNASYQQSKDIKIVLPESPSTIITNYKEEIEIPQNIVVRTTVIENVLNINDLLNFIDVDKLIDVKQSKSVNVYELINLKDLAKELGISFSNVNKKIILERIKEKLTNVFQNNPNLIADIKQLSNITLPILNKLFDKHNISLEKKNSLLEKIKPNLNIKLDLKNTIIKILESEWVKAKIKK